MEHSFWFVFIMTAVILNISPGPDMIYLITQSMSNGKKVGFASVLGLGTGALIHTVFVSLGISAIISTSIIVFRIMKYIGAGYLFFLGIKALIFGELDFSSKKKNGKKKIDKKKPGNENQNICEERILEEKKNKSFLKSYLNAVIIDVTNPKVAIFFMAFLPQFYRDNGQSQVSQFLLLGIIIVAIGFIIESLIVILSDRIAVLLKRRPIVSKIIDKLFGSVLIALGIKLVLEERN